MIIYHSIITFSTENSDFVQQLPKPKPKRSEMPPKRKQQSQKLSRKTKRAKIEAHCDSNIEKITNNPGFSHISSKIFELLDHKDQLTVRSVCQSWKAHIDEPHFWIKKLDRKGQSKDLRKKWIDLFQRIEKGSTIESDLLKCLKKFHVLFPQWKPEVRAGITPIHYAAMYGNLNLLKFIASNIDDFNSAKADGSTPIFLAARSGHTEIFKFLAKKLKSFNTPNPVNGWTPIYLAARYGHTEIFKFLATKLKSFNDPNPLDGLTPIQSAARNGYTEIFKFLVSKIENPNAPFPNSGWTPMHMAAKYGHTEIIKILSSLLRNPNAPMPDGRTPLKLAIQNNKIETVTTLLEVIKKKIKSNPNHLILNTLL